MDVGALRAAIEKDLARLVALRRDLHRIPELGYQERLTSARVQRELTEMGVEHVAGMAGGTGILAHLPATVKTAGPCVALRADMDALPIEERSGRDYASTHAGRMHACGHDGHTATLLGAVRALQDAPRPNPVTFIFQPAEEGGAGGRKMCEEGALDGSRIGVRVERVFGLHGWPDLTVGQVATRPGELLAATDDFTVTIRGAQCHAEMPHLGIDPIVAAAHVVTALQTIASRSVDPLDSVVCTVARFRAGEATNVIPESAEIAGTVRTLREDVRELAAERFHQIVHYTARAQQCHAEVHWKKGYPVTRNDAGLTAEWFKVAEGALGKERVEVVERPYMGAEDFSFYGQHAPAVFFLLGLRPKGQRSYPKLHTPEFDFNDEAIPTGIEVFVRLATA